jgi:hypothetical protein
MTRVLVLVLALASCAAPARHAPPAELADQALPMGVAGVRFWGDTGADEYLAMARRALVRERAWLAAQGEEGPLSPADFLALSGGGADGAFGAGLLCGWTEHGDRPSFKLVTGISTGALSAPFAFLGSEQDDVLRRFYTSTDEDDLVRPRSLVEIIWGDAAADTAPLRALLAEQFDEELLAAVAVEHGRGRMLVVGTTNLDAQRPVVWDMGAIAASGHPRALELFRAVLLASAAIPGAFPPVMIDVEAGGQRWEEMHVDGGTSVQVFAYPPALPIGEAGEEAGAERERRLYVIRNARIAPRYEPLPRRLMAITAGSISLLIRNQGLGDLYRIFAGAVRDGIELHLAWVPADFEHERESEFDPAYMRALFDRSRAMAREGFPWESHPPGWVAEEDGAPGVP